MAADYVEIWSMLGSTEWVRRDALTDPAMLTSLQVYVDMVARPATEASLKARRASCGDRLIGRES
jgi:hypothetical protein